jgi:branched-chain amino acid aminotransferase
VNASTSKVWIDGALVDSAAAVVPIGSHGLHYGSGVFEGMRAYATERGPAVFRLTDHLERFHRSAGLLGMQIPYCVDDLVIATGEVISSNRFDSCYLRPIAFYGAGELRVSSRSNPVVVGILGWPMSTYFDAETMRVGIRAMISSWRRVGPNTIPHAAKATGVYLNSMLAGHEALDAGYDEAILLTEEGFVADGVGETIFVVKDGIISTPDLSASILAGITRSTVIEIAQALGHSVVERQLIRTDLYLADEVFMVGTAAEITPVREVDRREIGPPGDVTRQIADAYQDMVHGRIPARHGWLDVPAPR